MTGVQTCALPIYIFKSFPYPDYLYKTGIFDKVNILYVDGYSPNRDELKKFRIKTIYWSNHNPKYYKDVMKAFPDQKVICTTLFTAYITSQTS